MWGAGGRHIAGKKTMDEASSNKSETLHNAEQGGRNLRSGCRLELPGARVLGPPHCQPPAEAQILIYTPCCPSVLLGKLHLA